MGHTSGTLFRYIFRDLLRVFFMASGALAGIMSFGGLLRPLTQNGLDGPQVALLLANFMPAMSTYSLPVAALFATTMVYGRLSADNEVTACRASGISYLALTLPALVLGFVVAGMSLYLLWFTVPGATKQIERVIYSNLAKVIAHEIQQTHRTDFGPNLTVFARDAYLPPESPLAGASTEPAGEGSAAKGQSVVLKGPLIVSYAAPADKPRYYPLPKDFWSSGLAVAKIVQDPEDGSATLTVTLRDGVVFPRSVGAIKAGTGGAATASFGPIVIPSRVAEKTKFLTVNELRRLRADPSRGQQVRAALDRFIRADQSAVVAEQMAAGLRSPLHRTTVRSTGPDTAVLSVPPGATVAAPAKAPGVLMLTAPDPGPAIVFRQESGGQVRLTAEGHACRVRVTVPEGQSSAAGPMVAQVEVDTPNALVDIGDVADTTDVGGGREDDPPAPAPLDKQFTVALPPAAVAMSGRTAQQYMTGNVGTKAGQRRLTFAWFDLINHIASEVHARAAFVVSCLLLVLVGSSLGMMFRSGNFLTAFAVSVIPAMLSVVLIVTGQHTAESTPDFISAANDPLRLGVAIIWSGNVVVAVAAAVLLVRLQRR